MFQLIEDAYEVRNLKYQLDIINPHENVEICETFGLNCLLKHCEFIKNHFTEVHQLCILFASFKLEFQKVFEKLNHLKVKTSFQLKQLN